MIIQVCIEWPGGSLNEEVEIDDDTPESEQESIAQDTFFNTCNYGWSVKEKGASE